MAVNDARKNPTKNISDEIVGMRLLAEKKI